MTPAAVTSTEIGAEVGDEAGLEQHGARRCHRQEEGEIDDDRVAPAIAQRLEQIALRHQRRDRHDRAGAGKAERQRDERQGRRSRR